MPKIQFDRKISHLKSFDTVAYNKQSELLIIYFDDGHTEMYTNITQKLMFHFLLSNEKERFLQDHIIKKKERSLG